MTQPRQRMIEAASDLLCRDGYAATSMRGIVDEADAPWGSLHHYFPGGKQQIGVLAISLGDREIAGTIEACLENCETPGEGVRRLFEVHLRRLRDSGWEAGCPIATTALETASQDNEVAVACRAAFSRWEGLLAQAFEGAGASPDRAGELASIVLVNFEGALLLSRVSRSERPMTLAARTLVDLLDGELAPPR